MNALNFIFPLIVSDSFLHITDIHYDPLYSINSPTKCFLGNTGLGCCHKYDIPLKNSHKASKWGDYNCDLSYTFLDSTFKWIKKEFYNSTQFIIYTGDSAGHHDFSNSLSVVKKSIRDIHNLFTDYLPNKPVFNNLGNHDTFPIDQTQKYIYKHLLNYIADTWSYKLHLNDMADINVRKGGYYSYDIHNSTKIISFNSIFYDNNNIFKNKKNLENDPQILWLQNELLIARLNEQKVWFISHIFPSAGESTKEYNHVMKKIFYNFKDIIIHQWWGHSHNDQFIIYRNDNDTSNNYYSCGMITPSLMPDKRFPSFRIYDYDPLTFKLIDYTQYYANLTEIILTNNFEFKKQYSFRELYNLSNMDCKNYYTLYNKIHNGTLYQKYCNQYTPGFKNCVTNNIIT